MKSIKEISRSFNNHASEYANVAHVQFEIGQRLFDRLDYLKINPKFILDLGCGPGTFLKPLQKRFPKAQIVGVDLARAMLIVAQKKQLWFKKDNLVNADMHQMPFASGQFDLVFSNQAIHWSHSLPTLIKEINRIMNPGGCLMFTTLGPDTFQELRQTFQNIDTYAHVNEFYDMHHIGDCLLSELFEDPVVDMEMMTAHYSSLPDLLSNIKAQGVRNIHQGRSPGLMGKTSWKKFEQLMMLTRTETEKYPLTYEVVYGHAWKSQRHRTQYGIETRISVDELKASLNQKV